MRRYPLSLSDAQRDRAVGALLGTAAGDALGAGYKSRPPIRADEPVAMIGGGPGEWTDDTAMAIAVLETAAFGGDLRDPQALEDIVERWAWWARNAKDIGPQTKAVLSAVAENTTSAWVQAALDAAVGRPAGTGRTLDGSCLTRVVPAALADLRPDHDRQAAAAARAVCELTHVGADAGEACELWCLAVRHAVLTGQLDVRIGLRNIASERRELWEARIAEAEDARPSDFNTTDGGVLAAFQAAWSAIAGTPVPDDDPAAGVFRADHLRLALEAAVRGAGLTGTGAAIAGGLLGAAYGASAVPSNWRLVLRGSPGLNTHLLVNLVDRVLNDGEPERFDHTYRAYVPGRKNSHPRRHPHDDGLLIGAAESLRKLPAGVHAVVSLCRVADGHVPAGVRHLDVRLIDQPGANANLDFVLLDTARAIEQLRAEGATVFLHGLVAHSRTPAVAALYGARRAGIEVDRALAGVCAVLHGADPNLELRAALYRLHPTTERAQR